MRISDWSSDVCSSDQVLSYTKLRVGSPYNRESLDLALKDLFATELFSDVQIRDDQGNLTIEIKENPVINRIVLEGIGKHTSELQSLMRISYAVFCLKKKNR